MRDYPPSLILLIQNYYIIIKIYKKYERVII